MAYTIEQLQAFSNTKPELRYITEEIIDYLEANPSGGGGSTGALQEDILYADLVVKINAGTLTKGQQYKITDYATKHYIVDAVGTQYLDSIITGENESLIVIATSTNTIDKEVKSILYPEDIIYYDWNPANWLDDLSFADTGVIIEGFKGVIYFRHDTLLDNYMGYDFRNCKFRRWKTDCPIWDSGTTYAQGTFVNSSGFIYKALRGANTNNIPDNGSDWWVRTLDLSKTEYWNSITDNSNQIPSGTDFIDVKTFAEGTGTATYELCCTGNHFGGAKDNATNLWNIGTLLLNNVFFLQDGLNYWQVYFNNVGTGNGGNTIAGEFRTNVIGTDFSYNQINDLFSCSIGNAFIFNVIGSSFHTNTIGDDFENNAIGNNFRLNIIGATAQVVVGNLFQKNIITNGNGSYIGNNFQLNSGSLNSLDFTSATHVYAEYNTTIFLRPDGLAKLSYCDNSDVIQIVDANA